MAGLDREPHFLAIIGLPEDKFTGAIAPTYQELEDPLSHALENNRRPFWEPTKHIKYYELRELTPEEITEYESPKNEPEKPHKGSLGDLVRPFVMRLTSFL